MALLAATAAVSAGVPAVGREGAPVAGIRVERVLSAVLTIGPGGRTEISEVGGFERRVDPSGEVLAETDLEPHDGRPLPPLGEFRCVGQGRTGAGFTDHSRASGPARLDLDAAGSGMRAAFWAYSLDPARLVGENRRPTRQVEVCLAGGALATDDWRLLQAGAGVAYDEGDRTFKLGMDWPKGPTPAEATGGFQLGSPVKAGVVGRILQDPEDRLLGSFLGPVDSEFDEYFENGVAGWWNDLCLDGTACTAADGSDRFHGNLAYAVWEYLPDEIPADGLRFRLAAFATFACVPGMEGCLDAGDPTEEPDTDFGTP